jgi:hydroxymethylbilane synthase
LSPFASSSSWTIKATVSDRLVVASRGSKLALEQAGIIVDLLRRVRPKLDITVQPVTTTGDRDRRSFAAIGGKGLFVKELEREVAEGRADIAVHSAKDLTAELAAGCAIVCWPARASANDVVVGGGSGDAGEQRLSSLPPGATVGTSSMRRRALLAELRSDLEVVDFRGNLDTRLAKVRDGVVDAAILAAAGMERLGGSAVDAASLDPERWVPAPGQGALAVEARSDRADLAELVAPIDDARVRAEVTCERAFAARLEGGCSVPLGCLARVVDDRLVVTGYLGHPDGHESLRDRISGGVDEADLLGAELADAILRAGGDELLDELSGLKAPEIASP